MATYIKGLTDAPPMIAPFQPNLNLVQKALSTLQNRYDQGFASVRNVYNQTLNAPLSDVFNQEMKGSFLKEAETRLKNLASVDLSLPENQAAAENVFAPFWEDDFILKDAGTTRWYQNEMQKALATRDSKDEKIRSQFSDTAFRYLQNGLQQLQTAGRDSNRYSNLEKRRFVPFQNMQAYLNEQANKQNLKIEWVTEEGPMLVTREGGARTAPRFQSWAKNTLGDAFQDQFRVMGIVEKEERIQVIKANDPTITDTEALRLATAPLLEEMQRGLKQQKSSIEGELKNVVSKIEEYTGLQSLTPAQDAALERLSIQQLQLEKQLEAATNEVNDFADKGEQKILENPNGYFASLLKQRTVQGWASARAVNQQMKADINPVWQEKNRLAKERRDYNLELQKYRLDVEKYKLEKWKAEHPVVKSGKRKSTNPDGTENEDDDSDMTDVENAAHFEALGQTDVTKTGKVFELFEGKQKERWTFAHDELFDMRVGGTLLRKLGVPTEKVVEYLSVMRNLAADPEGNNLKPQERALLYNLDRKLLGKEEDEVNPDEASWLQKITGFFGLGKSDPSEPNIDFYKVRKDLLQALKTNLDGSLRDGAPGFTNDDSAMLLGYVSATRALEEHQSLEQKRKQLVKEQITNNTETYKKILVQRDGEYDISNVEDVVHDFKPITLVSMSTREKMFLSAKDFADLYINGDFGFAGRSEVFIHGEKFAVSAFDGKEGISAERALNNFYNAKTLPWQSTDATSLEAKYGSSMEQKKLRDQLKVKIIPNLPEYQSETGKMGFVLRYDINKKTHSEPAIRLISETRNPANHRGIYSNGSLITTDGDIKAISALMSLGEDDLEEYISAVRLKTVGVNGRPSLEITLKPAKDGDKIPFAGKNLNDLIAMGPLEFDINPYASGETLRKIRFNPGNYIYGSLLQGKPLLSDPILDAANFSFKVIPDDPKNPRGAIVEVKTKEFVDGAFVDAPLARQQYSFTDITPDELVNNIYSFFHLQLSKNIAAQKRYKQQQKQQQQQDFNIPRGRTPQQVLDDVSRRYRQQ